MYRLVGYTKPKNWWWDEDRDIIHTATEIYYDGPPPTRNTGLINQHGQIIVYTPDSDYFGFVPLEEK